MKPFAPTFMLAAAAPVMALVFAIAASSIVLLLAGSNPLEAYSDMLKHASKLETQDRHPQPGNAVVHLRYRRGDRLQDEPLQHRRRGPVPPGRPGRGRGRWRHSPSGPDCTSW